MFRGTSISERPAPRPTPLFPAADFARETSSAERLLTTAEGNAFLRRAKGFLEKRRSSGIDSPRYIQRGKRGAVLYRVSDLIAWENQHLCTSSSDHDDPDRLRG